MKTKIKICKRCEQEVKEFYPGRQICRPCQIQYQRRANEKRRGLPKYSLNYRPPHTTRLWTGRKGGRTPLQSDQIKAYNRRRREQVLNAYGHQCKCCGVGEFEFLAIDHVNNDGVERRKEHGSGQQFIGWLIKHEFPEEFQVLCHNCNMAKGFYGQCPHMKDKIW